MKRPLVAALVLALLGVLSLSRGGAARLVGDVAWPSLRHPLGVDPLGRDFLGVLAEGGRELIAPATAAAAIVLAVVAVDAWLAVRQPLLGTGGAAARRGLVWTGPPRLLAVMLVQLALAQPVPWVAGVVVAALRVPLLRHEVGVRLQELRREQALTGLVAHGLPLGRIVGRHLLGGHLRPTVVAHAGGAAAEAAFTQIALAHLFGGTSTSQGLASSWGMEMRRLSTFLPSNWPATCPPEGACPALVATWQAAVLLGAAWWILGGLAAPSHDGGA